MAQDQALAAMRRIEDALGRIEAAVDRPDTFIVDPALVARHAALRRGVGALIERIDGLIAAEATA